MHQAMTTRPPSINSAEPDQPMTEAILHRMTNFDEMAAQAIAGAAAIRDRLFGSGVTAEGMATPLKSVPDGFMGRFGDIADSLSDNLFRLDVILREINGRI